MWIVGFFIFHFFQTRKSGLAAWRQVLLRSERGSFKNQRGSQVANEVQTFQCFERKKKIKRLSEELSKTSEVANKDRVPLKTIVPLWGCFSSQCANVIIVIIYLHLVLIFTIVFLFRGRGVFENHYSGNAIIIRLQRVPATRIELEFFCTTRTLLGIFW